MSGRGRVVVGVDGSAGGRAALAFALRDAARRDAAVEVVIAYAIPEYSPALYGLPAVVIAPPEQVRDAARRQATQVAEEVVAELVGELPRRPPVTVTAVAGAAAPALIAAARDADLLVVGSRGHGAFAGMLLGSVGLQCALHATCPVTVVHPTVPAPVAETVVRPEPALTEG